MQAHSGTAPRQLWALPKPQHGGFGKAQRESQNPLSPLQSSANSSSPGLALTHTGVTCTPSVPSDDGPSAPSSCWGGGPSLAPRAAELPPTAQSPEPRAARKTGTAGEQDVLGISLELALPGLMKVHELSFWTNHSVPTAPAVGSGPAGDRA